ADGKLLTGPTVSPENSYFLPNGKTASICLSSTIDNQILRYFFDSCIKMNLLLGGEIDFENRIKQLKHKLPLTKIGKYGQIQEWLEDYDEVEQGHRHIS
uniref:glycosyl hydrolase family 95 catalytic domain-containing protein n=1 Tax=Streptococcus suis TaxID=1307 RepID=UPI0039E1A4E1